jgi:lipoprotein NlpI|tara:strand:+ start:11829 stop:13643 length:1815 start_codon:yes stop_codon:yes gene_type:complete
MTLRKVVVLVSLFCCQSSVADCFRDGRKAVEYRDFDQAIAHFTECIQKRRLAEGKLISSFIYRGISYHAKGLDDLAVQDYTKAIELNRDYAVAYNNRGIAYKALGKYDLAIRDYTRAIKLDRNNPNAYNNRGNAYHDSAQEDLAIQDYSKAIKLDRKYVDAYMNRGSSYLSQRKHELAIQDYTSVVQLDTTYAAAYFQRGLSYEGDGQTDRAERDFTKANDLDPTDDNFKEALARLTGKTMKPEPAARRPRPGTQAPRRRVTSRDTVPPQISVHGGEGVVSRSRHTVIGQATDVSGVGIVEVNGKEAQLDEEGNFSARIILKPGNNEVDIVAYDIHDNQSTKVIRIRREAGQVEASQAVGEQISTGEYHALLLAVEDYQHPAIQDLPHPIEDATMVRNVLQNDYTFDDDNITLLKNPDERQIIAALVRLGEQVDESDNVLIFYAGHGDWDERFGQGYWLPSDADPDSKMAWIYNSTVRDYINGIKSKNILLVSDACFFGGIFDVTSQVGDASNEELYETSTRKAMTSGTLSGVPDDSTAASRSVFTEYLVKRLQTNTDRYISSETLFARLQGAVENNSPMDQTPQIGRIREAGDEGGDFIFVRR